MSILLEARGITVRRGGRALLDDVSIELRSGEVMAVMGENGAGKSTLSNVLAGDLKPDSGTVSLGGRPLASYRPRELALHRAVLPQEYSVAFPFTAFEVVLLGRSPHCGGHPGAHDRAIAREALALADVARLEHRSFPTLSGGERARVMFARVLAQIWEDSQGPRVLLLDEPAAALDVAQQHRALGLARDFAKSSGATVLTVLHDLNLAAQYADRVALLKSGRMIECGPPAEVLTESATTHCFDIPMVRINHPGRTHPVLVACPRS